MERDAVNHAVIGAALAVHKELGPGLLESVHEACLAYELGARSVPFERGVRVPITYLKLTGHRTGLLINFDVPRLLDGVTRLVR